MGYKKEIIDARKAIDEGNNDFSAEIIARHIQNSELEKRSSEIENCISAYKKKLKEAFECLRNKKKRDAVKKLEDAERMLTEADSEARNLSDKISAENIFSIRK